MTPGVNSMSATMDPQQLVRRRLASFTGYGYSKGASPLKCALWVAVGQPLQASVLCPARFRVRVLRAFGADLAEGVLIRHGVRIHWPWKLAVGPDSWIGAEAWLLNLEPITVGADVCISQQAMLCTGSHLSDDPSFEFDNASIEVADGAWIATRVTVLRGVRIGERSVVGAGTIVARDVPDDSKVLAIRPSVECR